MPPEGSKLGAHQLDFPTLDCGASCLAPPTSYNVACHCLHLSFPEHEEYRSGREESNFLDAQQNSFLLCHFH